MARPKSFTTEQYVELVKKLHGDGFDYSKIEYKSHSSKVEVICKKHGSFLLLASTFLRPTSGCMKCKQENMNLPKAELVARFKAKFGNTFDYSKMPDKTSFRDFIEIRCMHHGWFTQEVRVHNSSKYGCPRCAKVAFSALRHKEQPYKPEPVEPEPVKVIIPAKTLTWKPTK